MSSLSIPTPTTQPKPPLSGPRQCRYAAFFLRPRNEYSGYMPHSDERAASTSCGKLTGGAETFLAYRPLSGCAMIVSASDIHSHTYDDWYRSLPSPAG